MMNIGNRPTVIDEPGNETIEVHIFDFDKDLYNNPISVQLLSRVRDELKFNSLDELKVQLYNDEQNIRALLADL
jgi:riboflavin kinase/FMN adenylyltransferase